MSQLLKTCALVAVAAVLAASASQAEEPPVGRDAPAAERTCMAASEALLRIKTATRDALAAVQEYRRQAEALSDRFGYDRFGPYVATLREQERVLRRRLNDMAGPECPPAGEGQTPERKGPG
jgi:hypothetical protein